MIDSAEDMAKDVDVKELFERIQTYAEFARSVLHLPFPDLEKVNPSFGIIAKYCELIASILSQETHSDGTYNAKELADTMNDIAVAIVDRDNASIIDSMCTLDDFVEKHRNLTVVK
ncbi:hypothetical protein [Aliivibrio fischeri]|uniref:hypothetical protein n=1 Tax=Aliivibrio fischeri TaxID=668 RepID=UPI00084C4045|nr:hypothetical protein [Aliivibrio fischeri]OED52861.1 hypothetical protein BEI47_18560 [Aliivibrio fischeri]